MPVVNTFIALVPVLLFLAMLVVMDSFKLVKGSAVATALAWGAAAALLALPITRGIDSMLHLSDAMLVHYAGPLIEETLKIVLVGVLLARRRIGFPVDAGVLGFAIGTGFAVVENLVYLREFHSSGITLWLVRGLGTALLHGGATAVAAMLAKTLSDAEDASLWWALLAGWGLAVVVHSIYNHLLLPPVASMLVLLVALPMLILVVFERSEAATRDWVGAGLDLDIELLQLMASETFRVTRFGTYLEELRERFPSRVVVDMFCMLRLELELSVQAKALLLARDAGLNLPPHPDIAAGMDELRSLRTSIGRTGLLALAPLHVTSRRDEWHRYLVAETGASRLRKMLGKR
jgi:RsiW-degrading membrane proteinase PrsW (M82 family)